MFVWFITSNRQLVSPNRLGDLVAPRNCDLIWRARAAIRQLACKANANRTGTCFNCTGEQNVQGYLRGSKKHLKKLSVSTAQWKKSFWKQLLRSLSLVERNNDTVLTVHMGPKHQHKTSTGHVSCVCYHLSYLKTGLDVLLQQLFDTFALLHIMWMEPHSRSLHRMTFW